MSQHIVNVHQFASNFVAQQQSRRPVKKKPNVIVVRNHPGPEIAAHGGHPDGRFEHTSSTHIADDGTPVTVETTRRRGGSKPGFQVPKQSEMSPKNQQLHDTLTRPMGAQPKTSSSERWASTTKDFLNRNPA